jgi:hypothetical protein
VVVLLSESASLTARETLTVLGTGGVRADVLTPGGLLIGRFSRWRRRLIAAPPPGADPFGYLARVSALCSAGEYEAVLAMHEQAWPFVRGRHLLPAGSGRQRQDGQRAAGRIRLSGSGRRFPGLQTRSNGSGKRNVPISEGW